MVVGLFLLGIILLIISFLTPIASGTTLLISVFLFAAAIVFLYKKRRRLNS
ncbi:hypothetical protein [Metabacillus malikii]|uniref:Uncharacterized membrane protein (DUF441 family) n=1 Tax=Metabacillus malikii TaxID=1504265 RepID=A0ABT9ZN94_9BACI|nr:hypothetical protein [Metabacillus malikii]MDQ0232700.1 uncharacterized membrane protein (DUF441 family) [Metabacillus malikii]